ncbi:hypothetical protein [uncultured Hymenobacter sp.]|uniref:hypothetical protein n=1 Tax=uncultured Hymenobacter sp. TaxID=170016 RepID=UPI0035CAAF17
MKLFAKTLAVAALTLGAVACSPSTDTNSTTTSAADPATAANEARADSMLAPATEPAESRLNVADKVETNSPTGGKPSGGDPSQ